MWSTDIDPASELGQFGLTAPTPLDLELALESERSSGRGQPGILLLDDDPFMLGMQSRMLRNMGYLKISTAGSAEAALMLLQQQVPHHVDVIVCDLNMPGVDGIEFLQRLNRGSFRGNVILLSGEGARIMHTVQKLLDGSRLVILGALEKPAERGALRALLDCWQPPVPTVPQRPVATYTREDLHVAQSERQWVLHYQPKVDVCSGALTGMEALVRWMHPQHGLVPPDRFIALAEGCGAIDALTDWVLQQAMNQVASWQRDGLKIQVAVNVSMESLRTPHFARRVGELAQHSCAAPQDVILEITESRLMSSSPAPLENLVRLRMQRFGLSIDDFGTGHSSLTQLRDVPFTELKVDRGFVQGARNNQIIRPMLEGSIGLAKRLGMKSVAEGVETVDDWRLLREIGCDFAQGWFIGRPMASEQIPAWLEQWQSRAPSLVDA
ncbi:MAG: EAL domain-containing response regulator [Methylibium sp.]|uniref:EAL domain-containing response regulator n=1 Tax=Methylibium sp. TaxID=2067992 RepID=UPI00183B5602|nr:EAL domain-containing response regulator [Methylibium sp.]MBA3597737.1 EAL domain-containing response regulator [Methylibium sp.]